MRSQYFDPIEHFPERIDQLLDALNRVCSSLVTLSILCFLVIFLALYNSKSGHSKNAKNCNLVIPFNDHVMMKKGRLSHSNTLCRFWLVYSIYNLLFIVSVFTYNLTFQ